MESLFENISSVNALKGLMPVFYTASRLKFNSYKFQKLQYNQVLLEKKGGIWNLNLVTNLYVQMLIKNLKYSSEQEWRIVVTGEEPGLVWFPFTKAIYMGKDISDENKTKLLEIAKNKN